jgi:hypothetical protein
MLGVNPKSPQISSLGVNPKSPQISSSYRKGVNDGWRLSLAALPGAVRATRARAARRCVPAARRAAAAARRRPLPAWLLFPHARGPRTRVRLFLRLPALRLRCHAAPARVGLCSGRRLHARGRRRGKGHGWGGRSVRLPGRLGVPPPFACAHTRRGPPRSTPRKLRTACSHARTRAEQGNCTQSNQNVLVWFVPVSNPSASAAALFRVQASAQELRGARRVAHGNHGDARAAQLLASGL